MKSHPHTTLLACATGLVAATASGSALAAANCLATPFVYTASTTCVVPAGITSMQVQLLGGGDSTDGSQPDNV